MDENETKTMVVDVFKADSKQKRIGKGNAIRVGLEYVSTSHLIIHDADLEYYPEDIKKMVKKKIL